MTNFGATVRILFILFMEEQCNLITGVIQIKTKGSTCKTKSFVALFVYFFINLANQHDSIENNGVSTHRSVHAQYTQNTFG